MTEEAHLTKNKLSYSNEVWRKATHLGGLIIPFSYYYFELSKIQMLMIMAPIALYMLMVDISRLRGWWLWRKIMEPLIGSMYRPHELEGDFVGATYILLTFTLTIALFSMPIAVAAIAFIQVGDALAALIGRKFGKKRFHKNKTYAGSFGCLIGTLAVAYVVPGLALPVAVGGAVAAVIFEAYTFGTDDNVTVPLLSGLFMTLFEKILNFF